MTALRQSMMIACIALLALAMHAGLALASAQQGDPRAIHKRMVQLHAARNYAAALAEAQKYEAAVKARVGTSHRAYGGALHNLGLIHHAQGQHAQAEGYYKRAKATLEKAKGASATDVVGSLLGLAALHGMRRQYTEAEELYGRALAILEKARGASHPDVAPPLVALTDIYARKGQFGEAEAHYKRVLALLEKTKGARHAIAAKALKVQLPPPEYIGKYEGAVIERVLPLVEALRDCRAFACARSYIPDATAMFCVIVIPAVDGLVTPHAQEGMRQHELGHCAGWPGDHPGARYQDPAPPTRPLLAGRSKLVQSLAPRSPPRQPAEPTSAQQAVLHEEDAVDPAGKRFIGSAMWRIEPAKSGAEQSVVLRCDIEFPERRLTMTISIRRNTKPAFRASHTVEITFALPADFPFGGVGNVPGLLMNHPEDQSRRAPLSGRMVKVTPTFYLLGLSSLEADQQRNLDLLRDWAWLEIPIVYNNGRRAIMTVEKGASGERAFSEAFRAWGPSAAPPPPAHPSPFRASAQ
jgi:tetratricopeptide (TPR) repeat protein